jgi:Anti-sigma factor NepR
MAKDHRPGHKTGKIARQSDKTMNTVSQKVEALPANDLIGRKLREFYNQVANEPVPNRFTALLDKLEGKPSAKKPS